jgi:aspartate/methionine/tyrosine aminotransferase
VAWLPTLFGLGPGDRVGIPALAYPTYAVGVQLAGATAVVVESTTSVGPQRLAMLWVNSPANPTGQVLPPTHLRKLVDWSRERGTIVVSDECYVEYGWNDEPRSILHPEVCGGSHEGLLALHSLSKRSNLAGYRAGFFAGDGQLIAELLEARKHAGMMVPAPIQAAMIAALDAGFRIENSDAGLYLWSTRDEDCWTTVGWLAERGILVAPGSFYGATGGRHVRVALTATDERIAAAAARLSA